MAVKELAASSPLSGALDYAILRLAKTVDRRPLTIVREPMVLPPSSEGFPALNIIQHPQGGAKRVACRNNLVARAERTDLWYFTDTMAGSSGAPVCDDRWRVVALHKRWAFSESVALQGKSSAWVNVGTQISAILDDLTTTGNTALRDEILAAGN